MKVFKTQGALVTLEITDHSLQSIESRACLRRQCVAVASRLDVEDSGPANLGGMFRELNDEFVGLLAVYVRPRRPAGRLELRFHDDLCSALVGLWRLTQAQNLPRRAACCVSERGARCGRSVGAWSSTATSASRTCGAGR